MIDLSFVRGRDFYGVTCYTLSDLDRQIWAAEILGYTLDKMEVL